MNTVERDINYTKHIINGSNLIDENYNSIYFHSNEHLKIIFNQIDVKGKECLSVLGSGDQTFYMYDRGAKSVDLFDINKLTIYYFYLRRWTIKYLDKFYPDSLIDKKYILNLLNFVNPKDINEENAYQYWLKYAHYFEYFKEKLLEELFIGGNNLKRNNIEDLTRIKSYLDTSDINFYNVDLSDENIIINKKYDIIFVSNIIDYMHSMYRISVYRNNLYDLLKDDGKIIATYVNNNHRKKDEVILFDRYFKMMKLDKEYDDLEYKNPGYVYTKNMGRRLKNGRL